MFIIVKFILLLFIYVYRDLLWAYKIPIYCIC